MSTSPAPARAGLRRHHEAARLPGQGASHGAQAVHRRLGSIGGCATPAASSGHPDVGPDGQRPVTTQNLLVHKVDAENGVLLIKGAIPGRTAAW